MSEVDSNVDREELLELLIAGSKSYRCGIYLHNLESVYQQQLYHELETERLEAKYIEIRDLHLEKKMDWNHILFVRFMNSLSDRRNRDNFTEIALRLDYSTLMRERESLINLETLLIATSGLLPTLPRDSFTNKVRHDAEYMIHKYHINPLHTKQWVRTKMSQSNEPIIRLSQMAHLLFYNESLINKIISIKSRNDIISLFNVEASTEWERYFGGVKRHIGIEKCDLIGINFVVPMLYAYGHYTSDDAMTDTAGDLNESLPAESNFIISGWRGKGLTPNSAYEAQALLQLHKRYCSKARCEECIVFRHMCSRSSILEKIPIFTNYQR